MKILGTGLSGLVGSRIVELLNKKFEFEDLSLDTGVDITNLKVLERIVSKSTAKIIIHLAAQTNIDKAEKEKNLGKHSLTYQVNVQGTKNLAYLTKKYQKKLVYFSTDFVFDGLNGPYNEQSKPKPNTFYAQTKFLGEKIVQETNSDHLICRITYPYRAYFTVKTDFIRAIINKFQLGEKIQAVDDQIITPTFIDDIAFALRFLLKKKANGLFHLVGNSSLTTYHTCLMIAKTFGFDQELVTPIPYLEFYKGKTPRPRNLRTLNKKLFSLGFKMNSLEKGLLILKKQMKL